MKKKLTLYEVKQLANSKGAYIATRTSNGITTFLLYRRVGNSDKGSLVSKTTNVDNVERMVKRYVASLDNPIVV